VELIMASKFSNDGKPTTPNFGDGTQGGPYNRDHGKDRKFSKTSYTGAYSQSDGLPEMGSQKFRPELPPIRIDRGDSSLLDGQYNGPTNAPTQAEISKKHQQGAEGRFKVGTQATWRPALREVISAMQTPGAACQRRLLLFRG
jgi:hypothetical protein